MVAPPPVFVTVMLVGTLAYGWFLTTVLFTPGTVGVGAVVINSRNEVLCVRELRKNYLPWKTPTGKTNHRFSRSAIEKR